MSLIEQLAYPIDGIPATGETREVAPGVFWVRMPIPFPPRHVNLWLLRDGAGWAVVDTGIATEEVRDAWRRVFAVHGIARLTRVICTHLHPDHAGLAGWLCETYAAPLVMSREEWLMAKLATIDVRAAPPDAYLAYQRAAGMTEAQIEAYRADGYAGFAKVMSPVPDAYRRMAHGDVLSIDGADWQVLVGEGHSPEHACLACPERNVMIAGDQILPRITPHIGVSAAEPEADSLGAYLTTFDRFRHLPTDMLVLPSHGRPFVGLHTRIAQLEAHHLGRLDALCNTLSDGTAHRRIDLVETMLGRPLRGDGIWELILGLSETASHLNRLVEMGKVARTAEDGVEYYRLVPAG